MIDNIELYYETYCDNTTSNFNHCRSKIDANLNYITLVRDFTKDFTLKHHIFSSDIFLNIWKLA